MSTSGVGEHERAEHSTSKGLLPKKEKRKKSFQSKNGRRTSPFQKEPGNWGGKIRSWKTKNVTQKMDASMSKKVTERNIELRRK